MKIKTVQWNIGGGLVRSEDADPTDANLYCEDGLDHIIEVLRKEQPDVVTLQEVHTGNEYCQTKIIASSIGLPYWVNHSTDKSFLDPNKFIGQAVLSRFPIIESRFTPFTNPGFSVCDESGTILRSKNGGLTTCAIQMPDGHQVAIQSFHLVPFHFFNVELQSVEAEGVLREFESLVDNPKYPTILQGDFNVDFMSLRSVLPNLFEKGFDETEKPDPTTPKGKRLDHTLFSGFMNTETRVISNLRTDHFPLLSVMSEESAKMNSETTNDVFEVEAGDKPAALEIARHIFPASIREDSAKFFEAFPDGQESLEYRMIPIDKLIKTKSSEVVPNGKIGSVERSLGYIADMENGVLGAKKRKPLTVQDNGDGTYNIIDGNATHEAAMRLGWKRLPAHVICTADSVKF